jgi:hypothetical protein
VDDVVATALITGGVGVAGSVLTYLATRKQADATLRGVEAQSEVERERMQHDLERLRLEQAEPHLQNRQRVYQEFMDASNTFHQDRVGTRVMTTEQTRDWLDEFEHRLNAVGIVGTTRAYRAAQGLQRAIQEAMQAHAYDGAVEDNFLSAFDATINAMREDTAPDAARQALGTEVTTQLGRPDDSSG